jgi:ATP-dependent protease ClpP protease subunit
MAKELYLYTGIFDFTAQELIEEIEENMSEEIMLRVNSPGGSVFATNGMAAKITEHGNVTIKVDGCAFSSASNILPYAKKVVCLDVSKFVLHRADMDCENVEEQTFLDSINKDLKAKFLLKVDASKFKEVTGYTVNDMFNPSQRINISLDAKQAKAIGLVDEIVKLLPKDAKALNERLSGISAHSEPIKKELLTPKNKQKMDLQAFKAEHPSLYNEVLASAKSEATALELDRVTSWSKFTEIDPKAVATGIESGKVITQSEIIDFLMKKTSPMALSAIESEAAKLIATPIGGEVEVAKEVDKKTIEANASLLAFKAERNKMTAQAGIKLSI